MDSDEFRVVTVDEGNIVDYPQAICFIDPRHETHGVKAERLKNVSKRERKFNSFSSKARKNPRGLSNTRRGNMRGGRSPRTAICSSAAYGCTRARTRTGES